MFSCFSYKSVLVYPDSKRAQQILNFYVKRLCVKCNVDPHQRQIAFFKNTKVAEIVFVSVFDIKITVPDSVIVAYTTRNVYWELYD